MNYVKRLKSKELKKLTFFLEHINHYCSAPSVSRTYLNKNLDYFITTPIFYVNSSPHIGHLYTALIADAAHRFHYLSGGKCTLFSTGTDEHGSKIQQAATKENTDLPTYCEKIALEYKDLFKKFDVGYTHFVRTTDAQHIAAVQHFWNQLVSRGHIYQGHYAGWYCMADESFLTESQLKTTTATDGSQINVSLESGRPVEWTEEINFKFKLSKFQDDLLHWLKDDKVVKPSKFHSQLVSWVSNGELLQDVSISRPSHRVHWGVPVPGLKDQSVYVWLDALVNYLTVTGYPETISWPPTCQVLGKDILKFHGVYWPAFLMARGLEPPTCLFVHSHWTVNGEKMSKSQGNVVSPNVAAQMFTESGLRYFLLREGTAHSDANYNEVKVMRLLNAELSDTLGNLLNRCCGGIVNVRQQYPSFVEEHYQKYCQQEASDLLQLLDNLPDETFSHYSDLNFYKGIDVIILTLREANRFFEVSQPWKLCKSADDEDHLNCVLHITMETLRICGIALQPIVPFLASSLLNKLGVPKSDRMWKNLRRQTNKDSSSINSDKVVLYKRIAAASK